MSKQDSWHAGWPVPYITHWLPEIKQTWSLDLIAGITLWGLVVPEAIAYTGLAGVGAASGIWAIVLVLPFYAIFGRSRFLCATPTSATAVTAGGIIAGLTSNSDATSAMAAVALTTGLLFLLAYYFKLGFVVHFISKPINAGFMYGLALYLVASQAHKLLGVKGIDGNAIERAWDLITKLGQTNPTTLLLSVLALAMMFGLPRIAPKVPAGLLTIVLATAAVSIFSLDTNADVETVGKIPTGFPSFVIPSLSLADWGLVVAGSLGVVLLAFSEAASVASEIAADHGHEYDPSNDLAAFGMGNVVSGFFGGLVGAGSMSSTATNEAAGAKTQLSTLVAAFAALLTGLFFGGLIADLPEAILGVLIIHAVSHHLSYGFYKVIRSYSVAEARIALIAAAGVLVFDVLYGLLLAMFASLIWFLYRTTKIDSVEVGTNENHPDILVDSLNPDFKPLPEGEIGVRFNGEVFYGNVDDATNDIKVLVDDFKNDHPDYDGDIVVILDCSQQEFFDYTTAGKIHDMFSALDRRGAKIVLAGIHASLVNSLTEYAPLPDNVECNRAVEA